MPTVPVPAVLRCRFRAGMGIPSISPSLTRLRLRLSAATRSPQTLIAYRHAWRVFTAWCRSQSLPALPATPETVGTFAAEMIARGHRPATAALRVAGVVHFHRQNGFASPADASVREVLLGAKRSAPAPRGRDAIAPDQLRRMVEGIAAAEARAKRDRAILLFGFATALRRSNLAALNIEDIEFRGAGLVVRIGREKNHQVDELRWIGVFAAPGRLCPVQALREWLDIRGLSLGPLFCQVSPCLRPAARMHPRIFAGIVQRAAAAIGLDPRRYGAHSLRAGFVTAAAEAGASPLVIMQTTGHRSMSMVQRYFRPVNAFNVNPLSGVL